MSEGRERISGVQEETVTEDAPIEQDSGSTEAAPSEEHQSSLNDVRADVERAFRDIQSGKDSDPEEGEAAPVEANDAGEVKEAESGKEAAPKINKLPTERGRDGKFLPKVPKALKQAKGDTATAQAQDEDAFDPELAPPERLKAEYRPMFQNLPKGLKKAFVQAVRDVESGGSQIVQQAKREADEARFIKEAVAPFAGEWAERGFTVPQGIMQLARAQQKLTDPKTKLQTYLALGKDLGIAPEHVSEYLKTGPGAVQQSVSQSPEFNSLLQEVKSLRSQLEQTQTAQSVQPIVAEMEQARREVDPATGKFKYPELHDESYIESLKTRVSELLGHDPSLTPGKALIAAAEERRQKLFGYPAASSPKTRSLASPINTRAQAAAVSVRGKSASLSNGGGGAEPPPEALKDPAATTRWVLENMRRGILS